MSSTLHYVEDAAIISNRLVVVIERSTSKYHQTLGDKIFGDPGRLTESVNTFHYCSSPQEISTDVPLVFGKPALILTVNGNELASLSFTRQRNLVSYRLSLEKRVGLLDITKRSDSVVACQDGLSHTACNSPDGYLLWQEATSLWVYDLLKTNMVMVGKTPLLATTDDWRVRIYPRFLNVFYAKGSIFQWRAGEEVIRKYSTETGALIGTITNGEATVRSVGHYEGQVYCVFTDKEGGLRILDENGQVMSVFPDRVELLASQQPILFIPEKKLLLIVDKNIHPKERCVTVRLLDCLHKRAVIQKIKIPSSL
jgi:hypothetical protein